MINSVIQKFLVFVLFGIVASGCALDYDPSVTAKKDIAKPTLTEVTAVSNPTSDSTPNYTFNSTEAGTITYGGSCSSSTTSASIGNNMITLASLSDGTYSDCTINVTDNNSNVSNNLTITSFEVDTTTPTISEVTAVTTPTNDSTPNYTFSSSESGTITYGGSCSSSTTTATPGNNTITLVSLSEGTYSNCTITVTDEIGFVSSSLTITSFTVDLTAATLAEVTAVTTPTTDTTPDYTFSSSEAGIITYGGSCSSSTTSSTTDNNTITLNSLSDGTYSDCTITVTDNASNSVTLNIGSFVVDTTAPNVSSIYPTDNQSGVSISDNISVTFSETMDNTSVTTNTDNTTCSGSFQLSLDNFSSCIQMSSSPLSPNSNKTFTVDPSDNLSYSTTYKIRVTTGAKDTAANSLDSQFETSNGYKTAGLFLAVGSSGTILTSTDGTTWDNKTSGTTNNLYGVAFGNNNFVAVGHDGVIFTSSDGNTWTLRTSGTTSSLEGGVTYGNSTFVAVGQSATILTSSDNGTSWTLQTSGTNSLFGVTYGNGLFVAVGYSGTILTSSDGITWTSKTSGTTKLLRGVKYGNINHPFAIVGGMYFVLESSNNELTSWTKVASGGISDTLFGITYGNGTFVTAGATGIIYTSSQSTSWISRTSGTTNGIYGVNYGDSTFVAVGGSGTILTSSDNGITWTSRTSGTTRDLDGVTYTE